MKAGVVSFPGSNCDRDMSVAFEQAGFEVLPLWHKDPLLPEGLDVIGLPGGFSFGDYLRCGAIAARSPVAEAILKYAHRGGYIIGICNGFQTLTEMGLLPGTLMRNIDLNFVCRSVNLRVEVTDSVFTSGYREGQRISIPVAHHDGNYVATSEAISRLEAEGRVAFRYMERVNGSVNDIAGILSKNSRILGMMPHPERAARGFHGASEGRTLFKSLIEATVAA